jgi:hypothetical protein
MFRFDGHCINGSQGHPRGGSEWHSTRDESFCRRGSPRRSCPGALEAETIAFWQSRRAAYRLRPYWESPEFLRQYELRGEPISADPGARLTIDPEAIPLVD